MKKFRLFIVLLGISILMGGCSDPYGDEPAWEGSWHIDNKTTHEFTVTVDFTLVWPKDPVTVVKALTNTEIARGLDYCYVPGYWCGKDLITFVFPNGVVHTFEGEIIGHDVRREDSWNVVYSGVKNQIATHTYTFTDEDYELIMEIHNVKAN